MGLPLPKSLSAASRAEWIKIKSQLLPIQRKMVKSSDSAEAEVKNAPKKKELGIERQKARETTVTDSSDSAVTSLLYAATESIIP